MEVGVPNADNPKKGFKAVSGDEDKCWKTSKVVYSGGKALSTPPETPSTGSPFILGHNMVRK
eukprot:2099025-Amphidinium_carterae.1